MQFIFAKCWNWYFILKVSVILTWVCVNLFDSTSAPVGYYWYMLICWCSECCGVWMPCSFSNYSSTCFVFWFCFASRSAGRQRDEGLDRDAKLRCLFPFHHFLFLTIFPVVLSPHPALASGYPARKWRGKPNFSSVFCRYRLVFLVLL